MCCSTISPMFHDVIVTFDCQSVSASPMGGAAAGTPTVLLVDSRPSFAFSLTRRLRSMGMNVVWATSMGEVLRNRLVRHYDLLMVNVDRTDEPSWLRAADYHRMRPGVPIWIYTSRSSTVDSTLVKFVPAEQLIYYDGTVSNLEDHITTRFACHERGNRMVTSSCQQTGCQGAIA